MNNKTCCFIAPAQIQSVVQRLPIVCVSHRLRADERSIDAPSSSGLSVKEATWIEVPVGKECVLHVELTKRCLRGKVLQQLIP